MAMNWTWEAGLKDAPGRAAWALLMGAESQVQYAVATGAAFLFESELQNIPEPAPKASPTFPVFRKTRSLRFCCAIRRGTPLLAYWRADILVVTDKRGGDSHQLNAYRVIFMDVRKIGFPK